MKKFLSTLILLISVNYCSFSQVDTIINTGFYKSYFDQDIKEPLYLKYKLWKGGGNCSREGFRFKNDTKIPMATDKDYAGSGFDMGHLANAADFAYNCKMDELTFRFYNCLPQYPNLNRGIWKRWETQIRKESQHDSLLIICGGKFSNHKIGNGVFVPDNCWKVVKSLTSQKILYVLWFKNVSKESEKHFEQITIDELYLRLGWKFTTDY